ncbi:hypothetical protein D039_3991A, partial [Vibrio parahaemolyticus EKP-028]
MLNCGFRPGLSK